MPAAGVGIDILEVARMERALARHPFFVTRTFTEDERRICESAARPAEHYASRFAARQAVLKALGLHYGDGVRRTDVATAVNDNGRPVAVLSGKVAEVAHERGVGEIALSLSFTHDVATAMALLVTDEVRPKPREERDPQAELMSSFKQARTVIDELERMQDNLASTMR